MASSSSPAASTDRLAFRPDASTIPDAPGCYLFKDGRDRVLYVGKAKSLRSRLANYFQAHVHARTEAMLDAARGVDWIVVDNEVAALHLEYNLIKQHRPRFNIRYRDDKSYPYLVLTTSEAVPRARVSRNPKKKGDLRFGPYAHAYAIRETLDLLLRVFPVRTCSQGVYDRCERTNRPCLYHHIGRCAAPCVGNVSVDEHRDLVEGLASFLRGDTQPVLARLETQMRESADDLAFERAAVLRDQLQAATTALAKQQMVTRRREDLDAVNLVDDDLDAAVCVFFIRGGRVVGQKSWSLDKIQDLTTAELLRSFLLELYADPQQEVPPVVLLPGGPEDADTLIELLSEKRGASVEFRVPQRGEKAAILATVKENAAEAHTRDRLKRASDFNARSKALQELQRALGLDEPPIRIECFDISHLGGTEVVGSMVVFEDGVPRKSEYRRFKLTVDQNDDFASMREVISRRFRRLVEDQRRPVAERKFAYPPNLVIVDGGPGQLRAALEGAAEQDAAQVAFVALAKKHEELWLPGRREPVRLERGDEARYLVQRVRDEAHRFAITFQRQRRERQVRQSELELIPGVGATRRKALLARFKSVAGVRRATVEDLAEVGGISRTIAEAIVEHFTD